MTTELSVVERASVALGTSEIEKKLIALVKQSKEITTITNSAGYEQCHASRMTLKNERVNIEKKGKAAREEATAYGKAVIEKEKYLIGISSPEEKRLEALQKIWDDAREAEKQAKIQAEMKRVSDIQYRLQALRNYPNHSLNATSEEIIFAISTLKSSPLDSFKEFEEEAKQTHAQSLQTLDELLSKAVKIEKEKRLENERQEALKKELAEQEEANRLERLELAELRAKQQERDAEERQLRAEENARIDAEHKAEADRLAEIKRVEQDRINAEDRRLSADRLKLAEEARVIREAKESQERADLAAKQETERKVAEKNAKEDRLKKLSRLGFKNPGLALKEILIIVNNYDFDDAQAREQIGLIAEANLQTIAA